MTRYPNFSEWLLDEHGEESGMRPMPVGPVKQSTLDLVDKAAKALRFRDSVSVEKWDDIVATWKQEKPALSLAEFVHQLGEPLRSDE